MADQDNGLETLNDPQTGPRILSEYALYLGVTHGTADTVGCFCSRP
jgi:hypothetical protein